MSCLVEERPLEVMTVAWMADGVAASPALHPAGVYAARNLTRFAVWLGFIRMRSARPGWQAAAIHVAAGLGYGAVAGMASALGWCIRHGFCDMTRTADQVNTRLT